jgi:hypothetical protein
VFAEIIAAAADSEQSNHTHLRWERQFGYAAAQNQGICSQVPSRGRPAAGRRRSGPGRSEPGRAPPGVSDIQRGRPVPVLRHFGSATSRTRTPDATAAFEDTQGPGPRSRCLPAACPRCQRGAPNRTNDVDPDQRRRTLNSAGAMPLTEPFIKGSQMRAPHDPGLADFNGARLAMPGRRVGDFQLATLFSEAMELN